MSEGVSEPENDEDFEEEEEGGRGEDGQWIIASKSGPPHLPQEETGFGIGGRRDVVSVIGILWGRVARRKEIRREEGRESSE